MEKSNRPQRNRRHSRRAWPPEDDLHYPRPAKRLFTPEIKRMLKEWLVRRRENPYPSREEKKHLAIETGLTYTQICNWFANWRRKLKNSEREKSKKSWGHLIKHYNNNAKGNVEQFSISSEDSIWEEEEQQRRNNMNKHVLTRSDLYDVDEDSLCDVEGSNESTDMERKESWGSDEIRVIQMSKKPNYYMDTLKVSQRSHELYVGGEVDVFKYSVANDIGCSESATKTKYKQKIMEKYLRDTNVTMQPNANLNLQASEQELRLNATTSSANDNNTAIIKPGAELSKWLESAAKFTPNKNNYYIEWSSKRNKDEKKTILTQTYLPNTDSVNFQTSNINEPTILPLLYSTTSLVQKKNSQDYNIGSSHHYDVIHQDEMDAAEALANLAFNCRQKMLDPTTNNRNTLAWSLNTISS